MKRALLVAPVLVAIFTTGCVVGPNYVKPTATVPDSFKEPMPPEFKEAPGWKQG